MDEVLPGLWIGDLACALSTEYLSLAGITHIVSALKQRLPPPPTLPCGTRITSNHLLHVPIDDEETEPVLVHFPAVNDFLTDVLQERWVDGQEGQPLDEQRGSDGSWGHWETTGQGTVLVHCQAGCSRSVALVVAYVMVTRKCSRDEALASIRVRRAQADPNTGFMEQLSIFEEAGYQIDLRHAPIRRFLMSKVDVLNGGSVEDILMSYYPSPAQSPSMTSSKHDFGLANSRSRRNSSSSGGTASAFSLAPLSSIDGEVGDDSRSSIETSHRPMMRRRSRSTVGEGTSRDSKTGKLADLSISPPMPGNTDALFAAVAAADEESSLSSLVSPIPPWSTSITSPHEVLIARSRGSKLPGGVPSIRGHEARSGRSLPKPDYLRGTPRLRCKMCRREIAARDHIVEHEPGKGIMAFDVKNRRKELRAPRTAEEVGGGVGAGNSGSSSGRREQDRLGMDQMFGSMRRSRIADEEREEGEEEEEEEEKGLQKEEVQEVQKLDKVAGAQTALEVRQGQSSEKQVEENDASLPSTDPNTPTSPSSSRPIQSAASLTAALPPHLAALRAGRAPPGAQDAQRKALEDSRERNRLAMERLRGRMGMAGVRSVSTKADSGKSGAGELLKDHGGAVLHPPSLTAGEVVSQDHKQDAGMRVEDSSPMSSSSTTLTASQQPSAIGQGDGGRGRAGQTLNRRAILHSPNCSSYFLEPLDWMYCSSPSSSASSSSSSTLPPSHPTKKLDSALPHPPSPDHLAATTLTPATAISSTSLSSGHLSGKLFCPNTLKCNAKLGNWDWAGMQCGCGAWITPAFAVARGRIDEVWE